MFEAGGDVDRVAHDREGTLALGADRSGEHDAGVDPDAHLELAADLLAQSSVHLADGCLHVERGQDRSSGIVSMRDRCAKGGHDGIAQKLVDFAAVARDGLVEHLEAAVDGRDELFRRQDL